MSVALADGTYLAVVELADTSVQWVHRVTEAELYRGSLRESKPPWAGIEDWIVLVDMEPVELMQPEAGMRH